MLRTLFWVSWFFCNMMGMSPIYWKAKRLGKNGDMQAQKLLVRKTVKDWANRLMGKVDVKLVVEGSENLPSQDEPVVFVCNHQSYVDIPVVLGGLDTPRPLMAKAGIGKVPFMGAWMRILGCVFVAREDTRSAIAAMRKCGDILKSGDSIIIFPEGTRSKGDKMGEFKEGAVHIATKAKVRIVPLAVDGSHRVLEGSNYRLQRCTVRLCILPPVETANLTKEERRAMPGRLAKMIDTARAGTKTV